MKQQFQNILKNMKEFWGRLSKRMKTVIGIAAVLIVVGAIGLTVYLNASTKGYKILYQNITEEDAAQVFAAVQSMELNGQTVVPQINNKGQVMVPEAVWDEVVFNLSMKDYTDEPPGYDLFFKNSGITTTDLEKKSALKFQLMDRLQETLSRINGVSSAVVTINVPESSNYVWDNNTAKATASVLLKLQQGVTFTDEQVSGVKNLISHCVEGMVPEDVAVVDGNTGLSMESAESEAGSSYSSKRLDFEDRIAKSLEERAMKMLVGTYGAENVSVGVTIQLNYDKIKTESKQLSGRDDDGNPFTSHAEESYNVNGQVAASGIVGEEENTDVPVYNAVDPNAGGDGNATNYSREFDYDFGYTLSQIDQGEPVIKEATMGVVVKIEDLGDDTKESITQLLAKTCGIEADSIEVTNLNYTAPEPEEEETTDADTQPTGDRTKTIIIIAAVAALVLLLAAATVIIIVVFRKKQKLKQLEEEQKTEETIKTLQQEIDEHKKALREAAEANNSKETAMTNEIRSFAKENPEITASLIRSMLKEDE